MSGDRRGAEHTLHLGRRIQELRLSRGLSKADLAVAADVSPQQIAKYEAGENDPSSRAVMGIAKRLGVSLDFLVDPVPEVITPALNRAHTDALVAIVEAIPKVEDAIVTRLLGLCLTVLEVAMANAAAAANAQGERS